MNQADSAATEPVWKTHLQIEDAAEGEYHHFVNPQLMLLFAQPPRRMLDVGCAAGEFGALVKQQHPDCQVIGIELNRAAAEAARGKLDQVFDRRLEAIVAGADGIEPGSIDTVILADVLEHMYDPWRFMLALRPFLSADAQIIASIPNTRHLGLLLNLLDGGQWAYEARGLLDITHIRFFTLAQIQQFFHETDYRIENIQFNLDPQLSGVYNSQKDLPQAGVRFGRVAIERLQPRELAELCTWQFFLRARPGAVVAA